ncbi:hypothetical protein D9756_007223 [Leucocoprinus leucothites]|uniref:Uncharacterized protein n=1 Tax=Leucocoprinus leucothites TaxID=201217 RepID=A0A8H5D608_9AGAR|nr:hypothetical protein D9756_007223 [Leucoagaricus leucothites]
MILEPGYEVDYSRRQLGAPNFGDSLDVQLFRIALKKVEPLHASASTEIFLFGIHCILFAVCFLILLRKRTTTNMIFLAVVTTMFAISILDVALTVRMDLHDMPMFLQGQADMAWVISRLYPKGPIFIANNFLADLLLLYRCYIVWGLHRWALGFASVLLLMDTIWGWVGGAGKYETFTVGYWFSFTSGFYWSVFCVNMAMTILTVGRIWWVTRRARPRLSTRISRGYTIIILILTETTLIYSACLLTALLIPHRLSYSSIALSVMVRIVAIIPNLMIVQIAMCRVIVDSDKSNPSSSPGDHTNTHSQQPTSTRETTLMLSTFITTELPSTLSQHQEIPPTGRDDEYAPEPSRAIKGSPV